jgi:hypothetical protein
MGTTADKIAKAILAHQRSGVIDLSAYRAAKATAAGVLGDDRLRELIANGHDPAHAALVYAQNFASLVAEQMSSAKELRHYAAIVGKAEDDYQPGFPPVSPVTTSHFTTWAFFDVLFGQSHETIGTCLLRIAREMPFPGWLLDAISAMQKSRMGFHIHEGFEGRFVRLREIDGEEVKLAHVGSHFAGVKGQVWFGRLVPPMNSLVDYHVFFTTPYVMAETTERMISEYLEREIKKLGSKQISRGMNARDFILKHGPHPNHWNEYIFCAYYGHQNDAVFLKGVPDTVKSLPHGELMRDFGAMS